MTGNGIEGMLVGGRQSEVNELGLYRGVPTENSTYCEFCDCTPVPNV